MSEFPPVIVATRRPSRMPAGVVVIDLGQRTIYGDGPPWRFRKAAPFRHAVALLVSRGSLVSLSELIEHCWGDRRDGGPEAAITRLGTYAYLWSRRSRLFQVTNNRGLGYRLELRHSGVARLAA